MAKKEKQEAQVIKALLYQGYLQESLDEDALVKSIAQLEKESTVTAEPALSVINSLLAEKYQQYFRQHSWQLYGRTQTTGFVKGDIATWGVRDFQQKISALYEASVSYRKLLQQTRLEPFEAIIRKGNARYLRPVLYDLLAHRAIDYFRNDERDVLQPAYAFTIAGVSYFSPAAEFARMTIRSSDSASLHHKALLLFQQLLAFHAADARPDARIDADLLRLEFVRQYGVMENKELLYAGALEQLTKTYGNVPAAAQAWYLLAQWHAGRASQYDPLKDTANRYAYRTAVGICKSVAGQKEESEGKSNCINLLNEVTARSVTLETEKVNIPAKPFRTLVRYRNLNRLQLRLIPMDDNIRNSWNRRYDTTFWKSVTTLQPTRNWQQSLPETGDYQQHSAEIKIDALPAGEYLLLSSADAGFSTGNNLLAVQRFHVSGISFVNNYSNEYFILDRENGRPLAKASIQVWMDRYDYPSRQNKLIKGESAVSDNNGYYKMQSKERQGNIKLDIRYNNDRLFLQDNVYSIYYTPETADDKTNSQAYETAKARVFFFTDRSIYRPGQTLYFKGIVITRDAATGNTKVLAGYRTSVLLYNANGEATDSVAVTTNAFGSCSATFRLPEGVLNGQFRIAERQQHGEAYFSVEEYKRPKFLVEYRPAGGTYKINDTITLTGVARAYAGNNISGAAVRYRVVRQPRFIYPWLYWRWGIPRGGSMEITNGATTTGEDGKFTIRFAAIPDLTTNKQFDPVFEYQVIADVTDLNGETRSGESVVRVSYKALQLSVSVASGETLPVDSLRSIMITTKNMNGGFEPALVHVSVYRLQTPGRLIRKRYWEQPDQQLFTREAFLQYFPEDEYANETDFHTWNRTEQVFDATDSSRAGQAFSLANARLGEGWYAIEATTRDRFGETVKDVQYVQLFNDKSNTPPPFQYAFSAQQNKVTEPGGQETITLGTAAADVFVIQQVQQAPQPFSPAENPERDNTSTYTFLQLNGEKKKIQFPATENDRGGFGVNYIFVQHNRFYVLQHQVSVPWTNKALNITYATFRDKTLPGSDEKWTMQISGYKKEKVAAEMLVSMYDASLDQFRLHQWERPDIWRTAAYGNSWNNLNSFGSVQSEQRYLAITPYQTTGKTYDQLLDLYGSTGAGIQIRGMGMQAGPTDAKSIMVRGRRSLAPAASQEAVSAEMQSMDAGQPAPAPQNGALIQLATPSVPLRTNFNETAFFFPDLKTDPSGNITFSFTMPEALTTWKLQGLAHTTDGAFGYSAKEVVTSKPLMVQPNLPRFLREGDRMELSTKIVNMTDRELTGTVQLELLDAVTRKPVDGWFQNMTANQYFTAEAGKSVAANFSIQVPYQYNSAIVYRFIATAGNSISDGEEGALPVISNSMLVTESMPLPVRGSGVKSFTFQKLLQSGASETLQQHALTVEFTTNPAWHAVQSLPYLNEKVYDCSEQAFNRFYANALAAKIAGTTPRLRAIFDKWRSASPGAGTAMGDSATGESFFSSLQKNAELKTILLQETPWVLEAKTEAQQKRNLALLFDMTRMSSELTASLESLIQFQSPNGGFEWFLGGRDDRYITQYILSGIGHLKKLGALPASLTGRVSALTAASVAYLDARIKEDHDRLVAGKSDLAKNNISYLQVQYLYMRSFFPETGIPGESFKAVNYYRRQAQQYWLSQSRYMQGMIALALHRTGDVQTAINILASLQQNAVVNEELGMYWKEVRNGYYWYQAPIETQSLLIEAFSDIRKDPALTDHLKTWLLKQKQTNHWPTTRATADACYALLLQGSDWTAADPEVDVKLGNNTVKSTEESQEPGTGYFKKTFAGPFVQPGMGEITVKVKPGSAAPSTTNTSKPMNQPTWGAVYWQYFEKLDRVTPSATPLKLVKKLFVERNSANGPTLHPVNEGDQLKVGDKIKVRVTVSTDRDMEYVHLKDMRAGCMEPVNVLSSYKWQDGLGYYETTRDASTSFFFSRLPKGTYVFEYPLLVTHTGNFSNGVTSIQCLYAPEFTSYSEGLRITVE